MIMGSFEDISQQVFTTLPKMPKGSLSGNALRALWKEISQLLQLPHLILLSPNRPRFFHGSTCNHDHHYITIIILSSAPSSSLSLCLIFITISIIITLPLLLYLIARFWTYSWRVLLSCFEYSLRQRQVVSAMGPCSELADQKDCDSDDLWIINATSRFKIYQKDCGSDEFRIMVKGWKGLPWIAM